MKSKSIFGILSLMGLVAGAFNAQPSYAKANTLAKAIEALNVSIAAIAESDLSCKSAQDCIALPTGRRACGGPSGFAITSKKNSLMRELQVLAEASAEKADEFNDLHNIVSICSLLGPPRLACVQKSCKASE